MAISSIKNVDNMCEMTMIIVLLQTNNSITNGIGWNSIFGIFRQYIIHFVTEKSENICEAQKGKFDVHGWFYHFIIIYLSHKMLIALFEFFISKYRYFIRLGWTKKEKTFWDVARMYCIGMNDRIPSNIAQKTTGLV